MAGADSPIQPLELKCPECKNPNKRYTHNQSRYYGCPACNSWFALKPDGSLQRDRSVEKKAILRNDPLLPGVPVTFNEIKYIIVSRAVKADKSAKEYTWREYGLFHPLHGYAWLSEYDGHWLLLKETKKQSEKISSTEMNFNGTPFFLYQKYKSATLSAIGEFPSNALKESISYYEFIAPPQMISCESAKSYNKYFLGESILREEVAAAAGVDKSALPPQSGVGAAQVRKSGFTHRSLVILSAIMIGFLIAVHLMAVSNAKEKTVVSMSQTFADSALGITVASPPFVLTGRTSNLKFEYSSDIYNNWAEAEIMLINDKTNETRGLSIGSEYYAGVDDEGSWSEGSTLDDRILSSVEPGTYHINVKQTKGVSGTGGNHFSLEVKHDVPVDSNFFIMVIIVALFPLISWIRRRQFEKSRWMNSDYSPFDSVFDE
jgi:hypothetical protein